MVDIIAKPSLDLTFEEQDEGRWVLHRMKVPTEADPKVFFGFMQPYDIETGEPALNVWDNPSNFPSDIKLL